MPWLGPVSVTVTAASVATAAWLPFLRTPLMADEAGFLLIGRQWQPGDSLYGDFWVDRPPLIIWFYSLIAPFAVIANVPDGTIAPAVKLFGAGVCALTVVLASLLAREVAPASRWTRIAVPILALALLSSPLLGMPISNGELLALPFVLGGLICVIRALRRPATSAAAVTAAAAGALAMGAALVKQNVIDVFVFALVALIGIRTDRRAAARLAAAFAAGSVACLAIVAAAAAMRGTAPADVLDAVVTFRFYASDLISDSLSDRRVERMLILLAAFVASGAAAIVVTAVPLILRATATGGRRHPLAVATVVMVAWEISAVVAGGSYWLHYLTGLVPGLVMLTILTAPVWPWRRGFLTACLAAVVVANAAVWVYRVIDPPQAREEAAVASYLAARAAPDDGLLVAFGHPNLVLGSGLQTTYPYLWSLPSRVHDPQLRHATRVLTGPDAPRWVVVSSDGPDWWDSEGAAARRHVERHFVRTTTIGQWQIWDRSPARSDGASSAAP